MITFNGEIYNYLELRTELEALGSSFGTQSDTEVILEAYRQWGEAAWPRLHGMFAFALLDTEHQRVLLVRDRFGVKPLCLAVRGSDLLFASTPRVIAASLGAQPNLEYVARGLHSWYYEDDGSNTQYLGVDSVPAGCVAIVDLSEKTPVYRLSRYYHLAHEVERTVDRIRSFSETELIRETREHLDRAVAIRLRADVELGSSLSGGLDSTAITAVAAAQGTPLGGYSFSSLSESGSESGNVSTIASAASIPVEHVWIYEGNGAGKRLQECFRRTLADQDAPFPGVGIMAQNLVFQAARKNGTKVVLGGQGGDEAFMGYRKYFLFGAQALSRDSLVRNFPAMIRMLLPALPSIALRGQTYLRARGRYQSSADARSNLVLGIRHKRRSLGMSADQSPTQRQILDVTRYSLPTLLRYEDRNSMGNGVESRLPFLDHRLVEFGIALPFHLKVRHGFGKWALREAMKGLVPEQIRANRDKRGFDVPQAHWIELGLGSTIQDSLMDNARVLRPYLLQDRNIANLYTPERMAKDPKLVAEAISLVWLASRG